MYDANRVYSTTKSRLMNQNYDQIKGSLDGLSRRDRYELLLKTNEWRTFRWKNLQEDNNMCTICGQEEGPAFNQTMDDTKLQEHRQQVASNKIALKNWLKENIDTYMSYLMGEITEDPTPKFELNELSGLKDTGKRVTLQLHHKRYFWNKLPWEYPRQHLQTLCLDCHMDEHKKNSIVTYKDETMKLRAAPASCKRCDGIGYLSQYNHIQHGVCFDCWGSGNYYPQEPNWIP